MAAQQGRPRHRHSPLFQDRRRALACAAVTLAFAAAVFTLLAIDRDLLQPIDDWWLEVMADAEAGFLTAVAKVLDVVGGSVITWPLWGVVGAYLAFTRRGVLLTVWVVSIALGEVAVTLSKALYDRPRPLGGMVDTSGSAFPSGHSAAAAVTAVALVIVLVPPGAHRRIWEVCAGAFVIAVAMSRTILRVHWLSDVVAGALLGVAIAVAVAVAVDTVMRSRPAGPLPPEP